MKSKITIEEMRSMTTKQLDEFIDNHQRLIAEGVISETESNIDFMGMSEEEIQKKYGYTPIDEFFNEIREKLNSRNGIS